MLTLKKVKELVGAPSHAKRTPSPKMLYEEGIVLLRREFDQGSHLTVYNSGYVLFSAGKRNTVFHIHDCCGDYAYDAAEGKGDVIKEEYFENCEWHIRALFEGERKMEDNQAKCEGAGRSNVCVSYHALSEDDYEQIAMILTQKKRSTLRGRQEWNGMMVANIMKNERRWGDLEARKSIVVDYKLGKVTKNNGNRCSAYVPEHHEAIVSPEIARAAHLVASSKKKCGVQDIVVIQQGALKGFVGIHPNWSGINAESIRSLCLNAYLPEEVVELNDMTEMRSGKKSDMVLLSDYLTVSGTCFINQSSPVITISKNGIRFSKACHTRLDDCEYVELLYHPILQVVILRKSNHDFSTAMHWREDNDVHSAFSARAFSGLVFQTLNWRRNCRYQCRGICRGQGNAKFLIFELDESRILTGKNQYEQAEECSINLKCRLYRSKWLQSITVSDVMESGQVVENPMIGAIPSRNEVQRELDDLLMSM